MTDPTSDTLAGPERDPKTIALIGLYRSYRQAGTRAWLETRGTSMRPLVGPGGRMLVEFGAQPKEVGEIVVFERRDEIVAHRIVGRRVFEGRDRFIVKGDAEAYFDPPIGRDDPRCRPRHPPGRRPDPAPRRRRPLIEGHRQRLPLERPRRPGRPSSGRPFSDTHPWIRPTGDPTPRPGPDPADIGTDHPANWCGREVIAYGVREP